MSRRKETTTTKMKRADQRSSITILVLGDEGVGKSSLISTFVSRYFSEVVPGIMTRVRLPPDPHHSSCVTTIIDSQFGDTALLQQQPSLASSSAAASNSKMPRSISEASLAALLSEQRSHVVVLPKTTTSSSTNVVEQVDSIVLVYDLDRPETFFRLENHWLPLIERCYNGTVPVIVAENKLDLFRPSSSISRSSAAHLTASSSSLSNTSATAAQQVIGPTDEQVLARKRQQIVALMQRFTFVRQCIKCSAKNLLRVDDVFLKAQQAVWYPFVPPLYDLQTGQLTVACQRALTRIFRIFDRDHDGLLSDVELDRFQRDTYYCAIVDRDLAAWKKVVTRNNPHPELSSLQEGKFTIQGFWTIFDVFISQNRLDVVWQALRKYQYDDDLQLHVPESILHEGGSWQLTRAAQQFLTRVFHQFADADSGILSPDQIRTIWSILPPPALPPWMRTAEWSDGSFSVLKEIRSEHWLPPSRDDVSPPSLDVEQSILTTSGISILSESLPSVEGMDPLTPLSYLEWMGHWHTLAAMAPSVARAELYRLGHIAEPRRERPSKGPSASRAVRVAVLGARNAGKTSLLNALCGSNGDETTPTTQPETSWTYVQLPRRLEDREGETLVVHLILTDIPECVLPHADGRSLPDLMGSGTNKEPFCDLTVLVFDCTDAQSWASAKEIESRHLTKDIPRMFVATKEDLLAAADASVLEEARQYCQTSDLEPPLVTAASSLNRSVVLDHVARCAIEDEPGIDPLKSKPHEAEQRAARRRKRLWLGGIVVVVVGVGWLWSRAQRDRPGSWRWLRSWWVRPNKVSS